VSEICDGRRFYRVLTEKPYWTSLAIFKGEPLHRSFTPRATAHMGRLIVALCSSTHSTHYLVGNNEKPFSIANSITPAPSACMIALTF